MLHIPCAPRMWLACWLDQAYILVLWEALIKKDRRNNCKTQLTTLKEEHIRLGNGQKSQQRGVQKSFSAWIHLCFQCLSKNGHFWGNMENIQKKTPAFKLSGPNWKRCSELWRPDTAFSCQTQKASKVTFKSFLSNMAQVDLRIPWDVLLQTNQKCKMYLFKIVYVLCKIDFFFNTKIWPICWENKIF